MQVILAGLGGGAWDTVPAGVQKSLQGCARVIGAARLLAALPDTVTRDRVAAVRPREILAAIQGAPGPCAVVYSGDTGFYSGCRTLLPLLESAGIPARVYPGLSSVQLLAAALGTPWQDWHLVSAHGVACDPVAAVMQGRPAFFLTGGEDTPAALCAALTAAGLGELEAAVGENLSAPDQRLCRGTAAQLARQIFAPLSVLLVQPASLPPRRTPGWPDDCFRRQEKIPMTKQLVRAAILAKLAPAPGQVLWDVGAGTGSVSIELAAANGGAPVYGVECQPAALALAAENRAALHAWNLRLVEGRAPEALADLPAPDGVFVGGGGKDLAAILDRILEKNPGARVCVSAIALETLAAAQTAMAQRGMAPDICQVAVSTARPAGGLHLLMAGNPIFLITGQRL